MFVEEAKWINKELSKLDIKPSMAVLDIGSSDLNYRTVVQPHIDQYIHKPLQDRGARINFLDLKDHAGVDITLDLSDADLPDSAFQRKYDLIICCNILEHVVSRDVFMRNMLRFAQSGTNIMITVPRAYPKHNDPIDTMYRPSPKALTSFVREYIGCSVIASDELVITDKEYYRYKAGRWLNRINLLPLRMLLRWYIKPLRWKVTCVLIEAE